MTSGKTVTATTVDALTNPPPQAFKSHDGEIAVVYGKAAPAPLPLDDTHPHGIIPIKTDPLSGKAVLNADGTPVYNYDLAIPVMLLHFFPTGILGLGLTALLASFMSGMAGNVTAFNTVWTYDIYQAYINKKGTDAHYLWMGRMATIGGVALSIGAAYLVTNFNNIMDALQLVFSIVNAPLFATFLLGMFWKRTTGHAAFTGLISGTLAALVHHGLTIPADATPRHPRRLAARRPHLSQRHGTELLDRHLRLLRQHDRHHRRLAHHYPPSRTRASRPRLLSNPQASRDSPKLVSKTSHPGRSRNRHSHRPKPRLRLKQSTNNQQLRTNNWSTMGLDIRIPLGLIFLITGGIISLYGFFTRNSAIYEKSLGINLNLTWGAIMFVFGLIMFLVGRRQKWQDDPVNPRPWEQGDRPRH